MKLSSVIAFAAVVLGVTACAVGSPDEAQPTENTGTTQQAMCLNYPDCIVKVRRIGDYNTGGDFVLVDTGTSSSSSGSSSGGLQSGQTFQCNGSAKNCLDINNHYLSCNPSDPSQCTCMVGCGGNGWPYGTYNPCLYGKTYGCNSWGYCTCY